MTSADAFYLAVCLLLAAIVAAMCLLVGAMRLAVWVLVRLERRHAPTYRTAADPDVVYDWSAHVWAELDREAS